MIATDRVLNLTNGYLVGIGALFHRYSTIRGLYRQSKWGIFIMVLTGSLYIVCLFTYFIKHEQVKVLENLSQQLYSCVNAHMYSGIGNCIMIAIQYRSYLAFSNKVTTETLENKRDHGRTSSNLTRIECFLYYKMWMNTCILLGLAVYSLCTIDLKSLTLTRVLLIIGLAYPHLMIADVLRFVTVHSLLINELWEDTNSQLEGFIQELDEGDSNKQCTSENGTNADNGIYAIEVKKESSVSTVSRGKSLTKILSSYELYQALYLEMQRLVGTQVGNLIAHHSIVLVTAVHIYVQVQLVWNQLLTDLELHLVRTSFITFLVMIVNDYVCLMITSFVCQREINRTKENLFSILRTANQETLRSTQNFLLKNVSYEYDGVRWFIWFRVNGRNFLMVIFVHLVIAAIVGLYQFFNAKIDKPDL